MKTLSASPTARRRRRTTFCLAALLGGSSAWLSLVPSANAATYTWIGGGGSQTGWSTGSNWQGGVAPAYNSFDTALVFAGTTSLTPQQNIAPSFDLNSLSFDNTAGAFVLGGSGKLEFGNSSGGTLPTLTQNSASAETINNGLVLDSTLTVGGTDTLTLGGTISGAGGLSKTGAGTLTLTGTNTYTGGTTFAGGTLNVGSASALGSSGTLSFSGGTLLYSAANTMDYSARFSQAVNQTFSVDTNGQSVTFATGLVSNGGGLTKLGSGTLTLTGTNTYTGTTTINAGTLQVGNGGTAGTLGAGTVVDNSALAFNRSNAYSVASAINGTGSLTQAGTGTLTLSGANTYTGTTTINAGTLAIGSGVSVTGGNISVGHAATLAISGTGNVSPGNGGTLTLDSSSAYPASVTLSDSGTLSTGTAYIGNLSLGAFTQSGGSFSTNGNTLYLGFVSSYASSGSYTLNGGTLITGRTQVGNSSNIANSFVQTGGTHTTGTLGLSGNTSAFGTYTLGGGLLNVGSVVGHDADSIAGGRSTFNFNGGTLQASASDPTSALANPTKFFGGLTTANVQAQGAIIDTQAYNVTLMQPLLHDTMAGASTPGDGGLTKLGSGTLTLTGANTYAGTTTISAGTLQVGGGGTVGTLGTNTGTITDNGTLAFNRADSVSVANVISGTGGLIQAGSGVLTLTGANTYTGATTISAGTLTVGSNGSLGATDISVGAGASFRLTGTGTLTGNVSNLTVDGSNASPATTSLSSSGTSYRGAVTVGNSGVGSMTQSAGTLNVNTDGSFAIGRNSGSSGTYTLSGTGNLLTGEADIGLAGTGAFMQSGGSLTANVFILGVFGGSNGTYTLSGGSLSTTGTTYIGDQGVGTFTQSGGSFTTNGGTLTVGYNGSGNVSDTYTLGGGTLQTGSVLGRLYTTSNFNLNGGTLQAAQNTTSFFEGLTTANVQANGAIINTAGFNVTVAQNLLHDTTSGAPATDGGLTKLGAGTLTLTGANTYAGGTTVQAGTLIVDNDAELGAASAALTLTGSGKLLVMGTTFSTARTYNLNFGSLGTASGGSLTYNGATVNGGFLRGAGQVIGAGGASFNGTTAFSDVVVTQNGPATFTNFSSSAAITSNAALTWDGGIQHGAGRLTVNNGATVLVDAFESDGVTTINSGGKISNSGTNLVLGGGSRTTINAGGTLAAVDGTSIELNGAQLVNNGTQNGALSVNYGSTAKGSGTFGDVTVGDGGKFGTNSVGGSGTNATGDPGFAAVRLTGAGGLVATNPALMVGPQPQATPGTTNVGSLTLNGGSQFSIRVQDAMGAAGSGYDLTHASGALTLSSSASAANPILISLSSLNAAGNPGMALDFDPTHDSQFTLVQADGGIVGYTGTAEFAVDTSGFANSLDGGSFSVLESDANHLVLEFNAVPEPSTWALLGLGSVGLVWLTLRQRRACRA